MSTPNKLPDPLSEQDLRQQWNAQADAFNQWESLDPSEQLDWAQSRAVAVDRNRRVALVQPGGQGPLPTNYIDPEHQGEDLELLQTFYQACQSEGGTADEICLRGIRAVLARWGRPAAPPVPESVEDPHLQDMLWGVPGQAAAPARDLLKRVGSALAQVEPEQNGFTSEDKAARVAIREVAAWLDQRGQHGCSLWLRIEADR